MLSQSPTRRDQTVAAGEKKKSMLYLLSKPKENVCPSCPFRCLWVNRNRHSDREGKFIFAVEFVFV